MASGGWGEGRYGVGVWGTGQIDVSVSVTGVQANGQTGTPTFRLNIRFPVTGVEGNSDLDPVGVAADADNISPAGFQNTVDLGQVTAASSALIFATGVEGIVFEGETEESGEGFADVTGVVGTVAVGSVIVRIPEDVFVTGVQAKGKIGRRVLIWSEINDSQDANWEDVDTVDEPNWEKIAA